MCMTESTVLPLLRCAQHPNAGDNRKMFFVTNRTERTGFQVGVFRIGLSFSVCVCLRECVRAYGAISEGVCQCVFVYLPRSLCVCVSVCVRRVALMIGFFSGLSLNCIYIVCYQ